MSRDRLGILLIGQAPREDLTAPLAALSDSYELVIRGALDALTIGDLPDVVDEDSAYPLTTLLKDQTQVTVDEAFLTPRLQRAIDDFESLDVLATVLLCAGEFAALSSKRPLLRPFFLTVDVLASSGLSNIAVLVPSNDQLSPSKRKWLAALFDPTMLSLEDKPQADRVEDWLERQLDEYQHAAALVIDYVGYPSTTLSAIQHRLAVPVFDLGQLTIMTLSSILSQTGREAKDLSLEEKQP